MPAERARRRRSRAGRLALVACVAAGVGACRGAAPSTARARGDGGAGVVAARSAASAGESPREFGPPNPWGTGALPSSAASGPEVEATRRALTALRAAVGFWRLERANLAACPTHEQLAATPAAAYDPGAMARDAWGRGLRIECQGARVRLRSDGPDGRAQTDDDVLSE